MFSTERRGLYNAEATPSKERKTIGIRKIILSIPKLDNTDPLTERPSLRSNIDLLLLSSVTLLKKKSYFLSTY